MVDDAPLSNIAFQDVVDLRAAENIFQKIIQVVNVQNKELNQLKLDLKQDPLHRSIQKLERECHGLKAEVSTLRENEKMLKQAQV